MSTWFFWKLVASSRHIPWNKILVRGDPKPDSTRGPDQPTQTHPQTLELEHKDKNTNTRIIHGNSDSDLGNPRCLPMVYTDCINPSLLSRIGAMKVVSGVWHVFGKSCALCCALCFFWYPGLLVSSLSFCLLVFSGMLHPLLPTKICCLVSWSLG